MNQPIVTTGEECESTPPLPLWRLFREALLSGGACRDIVEKHVMCKLNRTDLKFFYEVNTETRKLIKRSSRKGELKEKFKVEEMSSISTLEVAWENKSLWPRWWTKHISAFELLKRINSSCSSGRERRKSVSGMDGRLCGRRQGNLEMVKYCVANECPIDERACARAASERSSRVLKYLREEVKAPWGEYTATWAAANGHLHILEYLVERKY